MQFLTLRQLRRLRCRAQHLRPGNDRGSGNIGRLLSQICGVQGQEYPAAQLALRVRGRGLTAALIEDARVNGRSFVRTWCMRGTLHLLAADELAWLLPLIGPGIIKKSRRRYAELGLDDTITVKALELMVILMRERGPMTRAELAQQLGERGIPTEGQGAYHLIRRAALEGLVSYGPDQDGEATFVLVAEWLPDIRIRKLDDPFRHLARRYLKAYGPADPKDLSTWSGISMTDARDGFKALGDDVEEVVAADTKMWMLREQISWVDDADYDTPNVQLLPGYDPYLLGYKSRDFLAPLPFAKRIHPGGGLLRPVLLIDGAAAGTWKLMKKRDGRTIDVTPFEHLERKMLPGLEQEVQDVGRFLAAEVSLEISEPAAGR